MTHFIIDFRGIVDGFCDFGSQQIAVAAAQSMHSDLDRAFGHTKSRGGLFSRWFVPGETSFEYIELLALAFGFRFEPQSP